MRRTLNYIANAVYPMLIGSLFAFFLFGYRFSFNYETDQNDQCQLFEYKNRSFSSTRISRIETGCGCTVAKWDSNYLVSGASGVMAFKIKANNSGAFYRECFVFEHNNSIPTTLIIKSKF